MKLAWLYFVLHLLPAICQQQCTCTQTNIVQKIYASTDVIFWGRIKITGTNIQATVNAPLKGCLKPNQTLALIMDAKCPVSLPGPAIKNAQLFLITGKKDGSNVKIDKCGWIKPRAKVSNSDAIWLANQYDQCDGKLVCRNGRTPLTCDNSACNLAACSGSAFCETNPCHNCAIQYLTSDRKLKCGEGGGQEFESKLCPTCALDPCLEASACKDGKNSTCVTNSCFGCDRPIWVNEFGRQLCLSKSDSHQCADYGNINFKPKTCIKPVLLGYATLKGTMCSPVMGCLPLPPDIDLWSTQEKCRKDCTCIDFTHVDMKYDPSNPACNQDLGWGLINNKCTVVKGCAAIKSSSPIGSSVYATEALCKSACVGKLKEVPTVRGRPADWVDEANGETTQPQYSKVFPRNKVNRMDFKFDPTVWKAMQADLTAIMNEYADSAGVGRRLLSEEEGEVAKEEEHKLHEDLTLPEDDLDEAELQAILKDFINPVDNVVPEGTLDEEEEEKLDAWYREQRNERRNLQARPTPSADALAMERAMAKLFQGDALPDGSCRPLCGSGGSCPPRRDSRVGVSFGFNERGVVLSRDPESFPCTLTSQGFTWRNVGIRFKGGSSLTGAYSMQSQMLPFRIKMDESTKELPETKGQKFFGFSKLSFSNNWMEKSHIREILAYEILGASGIKAPRAAPVRVYFDIGAGPVFWGLYTMIEDPVDTTVLTFPNDTHPGEGNIYKPEYNTWDKFVQSDFEKKNNEKAANFSDLQQAFAALHAPTRLSAPTTWRAGLESVFDVVTFLKVLAAVSIMGNWDTYGLMPHNYYLYNYNGRLTWIPWDFNLALACDDRTTSIFKGEIGDEWPLISFTMADTYYRDVYTRFVQWLVTSGPFVAKDLIKRKDQLVALVTPHVLGQPGTYEAELPPHTTMYDISTYPRESQKLGVYINQRATIAQRELENEANRLRRGR